MKITKNQGRYVFRSLIIAALFLSIVIIIAWNYEAPKARDVPPSASSENQSHATAAAVTASAGPRQDEASVQTDESKAMPEISPEMAASQFHALNVKVLAKRIRSDPSFAEDVAKLLEEQPWADERDQWGIALALENPDVLARTLKKMTASRNSELKNAALELMQVVPLPDAILTATAMNVIETHTDAESVAGALAALKTTGSSSEANAVESNVKMFHQYAQDPDPRVRSEGLANLVRVDQGPRVESMLRAALVDPEPIVQLAAIESVLDSGLRSLELKSDMLRLLQDNNAEFEVRAFLINALDSFEVTAEERQRVLAVREILN